MEDEKILDLFFCRDERAIKETDEKYGPTLCSLSQNIVENRLDAEECVNDTYNAVWNNIPPDRPQKYPAYLCRIVRNISYNRFHKNNAKKRRAEILSIEGELEEVLADGDETKGLDTEALGAAIDGFLRELDAEARIIFVRRYFYSDSIEALSKLTGYGKNALTLRLFRMRERLRTQLLKGGFEI